MPWILCGPFSGCQERRLCRLHGHDLDVRFELLQHLSGTGDRAAGANATDENVDPAIGVFPARRQWSAGGPPLGRSEPAASRHSPSRRHLLGSAHRPRHAFRSRGEYQFRAIAEKQDATFQAHAFRHGQDEPISLGRGDPRQRDAGVATGWLHDGRQTWLDQTGGLGLQSSPRRCGPSPSNQE